MGLYDYTDGSHKSGFRGYRVVRKVNGKVEQHYFHADCYDDALRMDEHLEKLQEKARDHGTRAAKRAATPANYSGKGRWESPARTGVRGLTIGFQVGYRCVPVAYYPCVIVSHQEKGVASLHTSRAITRTNGKTLTECWRECCKILAQSHGFKRVPSHWYKQQPDVDQYLALRKYRNKKGDNIPLDALEHLIATAEL